MNCHVFRKLIHNDGLYFGTIGLHLGAFFAAPAYYLYDSHHHVIRHIFTASTELM